MVAFFSNDQMPEPSNNTEQSRVVIDDATNYFPEDTLDYSEPTYICYYSPGVLTVKNADGSSFLYSSVEYCQVKNGAEPGTKTVIRKSADGGLTWSAVTTVDGMRWASLFLVGSKIYIVGAKNGGTYLGEVKQDEQVALTKITIKDETNNTTGSEQTSANEPLITDDYVFIPLDSGVHTIPRNGDDLDLENIIRTQNFRNALTKDWFQQVTGKKLSAMYTFMALEGNMVQGKDGEFYVIYRIETMPYGDYALMLRLSDDFTKLELMGENGKDSLLANFPTTVSRFVIKYDAELDMYVMISNWWTVKDVQTHTCRARNVLGLSVSEDLKTWTKIDTLVVDREMINSECSAWKHAFQYTDFDFDGDDLVMTSRETQGFANTFHDGKYFTFYRVSNFRELIRSKLAA